MVGYKNMTEEEIKKLAEDIYRGLVFTDRHMNGSDMISTVFMPLCLLSKEQADKIRDNPPGMVYEYMDKAGNRSINGMPTFFSCNMISPEDAKKVMEKYSAIKDAVEKLV